MRLNRGFIFLFLVLLSSTLLWAEPRIYSADFAEPGSVLALWVEQGPLDAVSVSLKDPQARTVSRHEAFLWNSPLDHTPHSVALLGIPSTALPGRYTLELKGWKGRTEWHLEKVLTVVEHEYPETVIRLNGRMNALYNDNSERKKQESRELWAVLTSFNPDAIYHIGPLTAPLAQGVETSGFGDRRRYVHLDGSESSSVHYGQDYWQEAGTEVRASGRGRVVLAQDRFITGKTVVVEHLPGVYTLYYHLESMDVNVGQMVMAGERVGTLGQTGFATGYHVHWEMRVGSIPVDPKSFLRAPLLDTTPFLSNME
ncbi:MAG: M23 family metallopeptidase [Spirochaetales bacterium]|nr:M23 family metallopeptidase [Spirochaetales bacterium]